MRRLPIAIVAASLFGAVLVPTALAAATGTGWSTSLGSWNYQSSPTVADIDNDGDDEIVVGSRDGKLRAFDANGDLLWAADAIPHIPAGCTAQTAASPIDSSPAIADLDDDGTVEIVVGMGTSWNRGGHSGGLIAFSHTGAVEWKWPGNRDYGGVNTFAGDGRCEGVVSSPAIGDVNGDGGLDVVFGGFDGRIWALDSDGATVPGFPFESYDTIWSSPALFDVDNDGAAEIYIGVDSWPGVVSNFHQGGLLRALDVSGGVVRQMWAKLTRDIVASSPAVGDINGDARPDVVVATGEYWHVSCGLGTDPACATYDRNGNDHQRVWAVDALTGEDLAGWPVAANGTVQTAPALGDIDDDGLPEVVFGSYDEWLYAYNGDGTRLWATPASIQGYPGGPFQSGRRMTGHPIITDLDGDGDLDVAVGNELFVGHHDGRTGTVFDYSGFGQSYLNSVAVAVHGGDRYLISSGFDATLTSTIEATPLPGTNGPEGWPQFRLNPAHTGALGESWCDLTTGTIDEFCDVRTGLWYTAAVIWAANDGITTGVLPRLFAPDDVVTRAQAITFLWRLAGSPTGHPGAGFTDVDPSRYYAAAVDWAKATDVTTGVSDTEFGPDQSTTRAQMVTLIWRKDGQRSGPDNPFTDVPSGTFFSEAVDWAASTGLSTGTSPTTFSPHDLVTRAQLITMLYRWVG